MVRHFIFEFKSIHLLAAGRSDRLFNQGKGHGLGAFFKGFDRFNGLISGGHFLPLASDNTYLSKLRTSFQSFVAARPQQGVVACGMYFA